MKCPHCRAWVDSDEHRCQRCGRRVRAAMARPAPDTYPIATATAPALEAAREETPAAAPPPRPGVTYQPPLFREIPQVLPIPTFTPVQMSGPSRRKAPKTKAASLDQQRFDFGPEPPRLNTSVEAVIFCDSAVAEPVHRVIAAGLDVAMIVLSFGLFLLTFSMSGGEVVLNKVTIPLYVAALLLTSVFYHALFCLGAGETPGMKWMRLKLVNFDGRRASREHRLRRLAAGWVSLFAAGLGLLWALVDEEGLTWHDHISKTFPTPSA